MKTAMKPLYLTVLLGALAVSGCQTVTDTADRIWPFNNGDDNNQGDAPPEEQRVSIMNLEESLTVDPEQAGQPVTLPAPAPNPAWPMAGGAPSHANGHPAFGNMARLWSRDIGEGSSRTARVVAQPVAANGVIYAMDGAGGITAMNAASGEVRWERHISSDNKRDREAFGGGLAIVDGRLYATSGYGFVLALDPATGDQIWRRDTISPVTSAPAAAEGRVFAVTADNELFALDANNGEILWTYQGIAETAGLMTAPAPAIAGDVVIAPFSSGELVALQAASGRGVWQDALTSGSGLAGVSSLNDIASSPVVSDGVVYAMSHSGVLAAIDMQNGDRLWTQPAGGVSMPWLAGDYLFIATTEGEVAAINKADGGIAWLTNLPIFENPDKRKKRIAWAGPVLAGNQLILASSSEDGTIIDPATGSPTGGFDPQGPVFVPPLVVNGVVYVLNDEAELIAYR